jgi:hypothetical protein
MISQGRLVKFLKKGVLVSGAVVRIMIGAGASALLVLGLKKKKREGKNRKRN